jgi:hypothetical protein
MRPNSCSSQGLKFYHLANTSVSLPCFMLKSVNPAELQEIPNPYTKYCLALGKSVVCVPYGVPDLWGPLFF